MKKQKEAFLTGEGDNWFNRNAEAAHIRESDTKIMSYLQNAKPQNILEIGCGTGFRLDYFSRHMPDCSFCGIDPAQKAVEQQYASYNVLQATADNLPFQDKQFDVIIIGFCLAVCDVEDFFKIASEVDRVLMSNGILVVMDFEPPFSYQNPYAHQEGLWTTKMTYRNMFCWHPSYTMSEMFSYSHESDHFHPDPNERLSVSILHKQHEVNLPKAPYQFAI